MTYLIIGGVFLVGYLIYSFSSKLMNKKQKDFVQQNNVKRTLKENDKIIIIGNADLKSLQQVVSDFTKDYDNSQHANLKPVSKIHKIGDFKFAITFPYDIDFEILCYFVNYLNYPLDNNCKPTVLAWTSTSSKYQWLNETFENNKVIMFIDPNDTEFDNVMVTTKDNKPFKIGFAVGYGLQSESHLIQNYVEPPLDLFELNKYESMEIK